MGNAVRHFYEFGPYRLDPQKHRLWRDGQPVPLPPKAMEALLVLVRNPGRMLEREELMQAVWADTFVEDANLTVAISHLRKALGQNGEATEYIETIPRVGYRFVAEVSEVREEPAPLIIEKHTLSQTVIEEEFLHDKTDGETETSADAPPVAEPKPLVQATGRRRPAFGFAGRIALAGLLLLAGMLVATKYLRRPDDARVPVPPAGVRTIAVLPLRHLGGEASDEYLGPGLADALTTRLSNIHSLVVRPTSAVLRFDDARRDPLEAGRRLGVEAVLAGRISRDGERLRVSAQLLRVSDGALLWAGMFDEQFTNVFDLEDAVSRQIAEGLALRLSSEEQRLLAKRGTDNAEAFREYLKGHHHLEKRTYDDFQEAIRYFKRAIDLDPAYALAYAGLAECHLLLGDYGYSPPRESFPLAKAAALRALEIDDLLAEAHTSLAFVKYEYDWDWEGAEAEFRRAIELKPNYATAHHRYGWHLIATGRNDEAMHEIRRAEELDPLSLIIKANVGTFLYYARDYDGAIEQLRKVVEADPGFLQGRRKLAWAYEAKGMGEEAVAEWLKVEEMMKTAPDQIVKYRAACEAEGVRGYWRQAVEVEKESMSHYYASADAPASYYARLGDRDQAFRWLERAFEEKSAHLVLLKVAPVYDNLHGDPRFAELVRRIGLDPR